MSRLLADPFISLGICFSVLSLFKSSLPPALSPADEKLGLVDAEGY